MIKIGTINHLPIVRQTDHGLMLGGGNHLEILLPRNEIPEDISRRGRLPVFLYRDSEDRLIATLQEPYVMVGSFACLEVIDVERNIGAFLDWGLPKDLLLPYREQETRVRAGDNVIVTVMEDQLTGRLVATSKIRRFLSQETPTYEPNTKVSILVSDQHDLGYHTIVDNRFQGMLYHNELANRLFYGEEIEGYVVRVREDGKIDLRRDPSGRSRNPEMAELVWQKLEEAGGSLPLHDNSDPFEIRSSLNMSKKAFKAAIGVLYRNRRIIITPEGIRKA
jgi:uncharacterized protein